MSLSRRQLLRVAGTGVAAGLAGCTVGGSGKTPAPGVQAQANVRSGPTQIGGQGNQKTVPFLQATWLVNRDARYLTLTVENTSRGRSVETALCGVGSQVTYFGDVEAMKQLAPGRDNPATNGPVGSPPDCSKGDPKPLKFLFGDSLAATVTAHLPGGDTEDIVAKQFDLSTPTPTPTPTSASTSTSTSSGNSSSKG